MKSDTEWADEYPTADDRDEMKAIVGRVQLDTMQHAQRLAAGIRHDGGSAGDVEACLRNAARSLEQV